MSKNFKRSLVESGDFLDGDFEPEGVADDVTSGALDPLVDADVPLSKRAAKKQRKRLRMLEEGLLEKSPLQSPLSVTFFASKDGLETSSEANAEAQAAEFQKLFLASTAGKNLTLLEIGGGVNADRIAIPIHRSEEDVIRAKQGGGGKVKNKEIESSGGDTSADASLVPFVRSVIPEWQKVFGWRHKATPRPVGAPACIIITHSAQRAASLLGPLAAFKSRIGKAFAKHFSLDEQRTLFQSEPPILLAVATPNRLIKLVESEILSLSHCSTIIFDMKPDVKGFSILDSFATKEDCFNFVKSYVLQSPDLKIAFYN
jgi:hypothetical protein